MSNVTTHKVHNCHMTVQSPVCSDLRNKNKLGLEKDCVFV